MRKWKWRTQEKEPESREQKLEEEIQRLKEALANRTLGVDFFKGALQRVKARRQGITATGREASTTKFGADAVATQTNGRADVPVSRGQPRTFTAIWWKSSRTKKRWNCATHWRHYGYRRITAELRHRGMLVNHKRVARLMREDNLIAVSRASLW